MSRKKRLTPDQDRSRVEGLRVLARIIARHYLAHPELYPAPISNTDGGAGGVGKDGATVNAAVGVGEGAARKEAAQ